MSRRGFCSITPTFIKFASRSQHRPNVSEKRTQVKAQQKRLGPLRTPRSRSFAAYIHLRCSESKRK
jgi:hypothetical protein